MKKIYIALAVIGTAMLVSCVKERSFNDMTFGENDMVFTLQGTPSTRAAEGHALPQKGVKLELDTDKNGHSIFLEETIEDLNFASPVTKGTPAYTENVGVLYANDLSVYADKGSFGTATFANVEDNMEAGGWRYHHHYASDPWPESGAVGFYLNMPAEPTGVSITSRASGKFTFNYTTPDTAEDQQDILFGYRSLTKDAYQPFRQNGAPILLNHALTAVKFAIANYDADKKIAIKSVSFTGLSGSGTCVITPASEDDYKDNTTNWSSSTAVVWSELDEAKTGTYSSGEFGAPVKFEGGSFANNGNYPTSFAQAGNTQNLNDTDASQTFWFIPQAMTSDVKLTIVYTFGSTDERTGVLNFGEALSGVIWAAGQLRTYTIRVDEVNVKIEDTVAPVKREDETLVSLINGQPILDENNQPHKFTYYGGTKSNIIITNTGNTDAYIRAALIGQWLDDEGNPVFGFTDYTAGKVVLVDSWYQDQFVSHAGKHGYFVDLPGYKNLYKNTEYENPLNNWYLNSDGYYYYKNVVPAGEQIPAANPLFTSYTVDKNPAVVVAGQVRDVYFALEISTQAITAKNSNGTDASLSEAWSKAGVSVTIPE